MIAIPVVKNIIQLPDELGCRIMIGDLPILEVNYDCTEFNGG
jgi:hypothetical protein